MAITVPIITDFDARGINKAQRQFSKLETKGQKAAFAIRKAALPAALALGAIALAAKAGVEGVMADDVALANLESTLKSTGHAANITADGFFEYANQLQASTGVSATAITEGAALLGTFKAIRNETGKGNRVFDRATVAALDLSKKGFGSLESSNKMLGKALNDPIKGITALSRAGVTFTDAQKDQIKTLQESGDMLGAQKLILKEVESQVGGTAAAYGETTAGKVDRAKRAFEELQKSLAQALMPAINFVAGALGSLAGWMQKNAGIAKVVIAVVASLAAGILILNGVLKVVAITQALLNSVLFANPIGIIILAVAALAVGLVVLYKKSETFRNIVKGAFEVVKVAVEKVVDYLKGPLMAAWDIVSGAIDAISALIRGDFGAAWEGLKTMIGGVVDWIKTTILALPLMLLGAARDIGGAIVSGIVSGVATLGESTWNAISGIATYLLDKAAGWLETLASIGGTVVSYVVSGVTGLGADIWGKISGIGAYLLEKIKGVASGFKDIGTAIGEWIVNAAEGAVSGLADILKSAVLAPIRFIASKIKNNWPDLPGLPGPPGFLDTLSRVGLGATGGIVTRPTLAVIGEAGPEAVIPLNQTPGSSPLGTMGMGGGITINVQAGLVSTPDQIGQQIIEAIQNAQRRSGPVFAAA